MAAKKTYPWYVWVGGGIAVVVAISVIVNLAQDDESDDAAAPRTSPQRQAPAPNAPSLESQVRISDVACGWDDARGKVTNNSAQVIDVFIDVQFLDGTLVIGDSLASLSGLRAGETGRWEAPHLGDGNFTKCRADISSVFAH
jgi:hypothetical protein